MSTKICVSSLQILSSSVRLDGHFLVSPEMFGLWLVHSRTFTVVSQHCDGAVKVMGGHVFYRGGASVLKTQTGGVLHWWWTFWSFLPSAHWISASVSPGSLVKLVPDTQLEGLIQTDETVSESPPVNWIYGRKRRRTPQRWNVVEYKYLAVWSQGGHIQILLLQSRNILIPKQGT